MSTMKPAKSFNIAFKDFKLVELVFGLNPEYNKWENETKGWQGTVFEHEIEYEISHDFDEQNKVLKVLLGIKAIAKDAPFNVSVKGIGLFVFDEVLDQKQVNQFARVNCAAILFPYIREAIADVTRRSGLPTLHLQPVNFVNLYKAQIEKSGEKSQVEAEKGKEKREA